MGFNADSKASEIFIDQPNGGELGFHYHAEHYEGVTVEQETEGQELSLPAPLAGRLIFAIDVVNSGPASFVMHGATVEGLSSQRYSWSGIGYHAAIGAGSPKNIMQIDYGTCKAFAGSDDQTLGLSEGTIGNLVYIGDHGQGVVRVSFDGTSPKGESYPEFNARHTLGLKNVDLSKLVFNGSSTSSDYTVCYEVCKP